MEPAPQPTKNRRTITCLGVAAFSYMLLSGPAGAENVSITARGCPHATELEFPQFWDGMQPSSDRRDEISANEARRNTIDEVLILESSDQLHVPTIMLHVPRQFMPIQGSISQAQFDELVVASRDIAANGVSPSERQALDAYMTSITQGSSSWSEISLTGPLVVESIEIPDGVIATTVSQLSAPELTGEGSATTTFISGLAYIFDRGCILSVRMSIPVDETTYEQAASYMAGLRVIQETP